MKKLLIVGAIFGLALAGCQTMDDTMEEDSMMEDDAMMEEDMEDAEKDDDMESDSMSMTDLLREATRLS